MKNSRPAFCGIISLAIVLGCILPVRGADGFVLESYQPAGGYFVASIPQPVTHTTNTVASHQLEIWSYQTADGAFMIFVSDFTPVAKDVVQEALDAACTDLIAGFQGKEIRREVITVEGKYPGRECEGTVPSKNGLVLDRMFVANGRLYQSMSIGLANWLESPNSRKFIESLKATN